MVRGHVTRIVMWSVGAIACFSDALDLIQYMWVCTQVERLARIEAEKKREEEDKRRAEREEERRKLDEIASLQRQREAEAEVCRP